MMSKKRTALITLLVIFTTSFPYEFITKSKIRDKCGGFYPEFEELVSTLITNRFERTYIKEKNIPWYL